MCPKCCSHDVDIIATRGGHVCQCLNPRCQNTWHAMVSIGGTLRLMRLIPAARESLMAIADGMAIATLTGSGSGTA